MLINSIKIIRHVEKLTCKALLRMSPYVYLHVIHLLRSHGLLRQRGLLLQLRQGEKPSEKLWIHAGQRVEWILVLLTAEEVGKQESHVEFTTTTKKRNTSYSPSRRPEQNILIHYTCCHDLTLFPLSLECIHLRHALKQNTHLTNLSLQRWLTKCSSP